MDLKKFDSITNAEKGVELVLEEKSEKGEGAALVLLGADSEACRRITHEIAQRNRTKRGELTDAEVSAQGVEKLAACTKGWRGLEENGKPLEFSNAAAVKLYTDYPELADMAARFIFTRDNFFPTASTS